MKVDEERLAELEKRHIFPWTPEMRVALLKLVEEARNEERRQTEIVRQAWLNEPKALPASRYGWWVFLDAYEIGNLVSMIEAVGYNGPSEPPPGPLAVFNSGDWIGQIYWKICKLAPESKGNNSPEGYRRDAAQRV